MTAEIVRPLQGFSGNRIFLLQHDEHVWVRKQGNISRNLSRMTQLQNILPMPRILDQGDDWFDMEFIHGLDMASYLTIHGHRALTDFLIWAVTTMSANSQLRDYSDRYQQYLESHPWSDRFEFSTQQLASRLPAQLPASDFYFGDLTLENMIYGQDQRFYFIDGQDSVWDSWVFDLVKLRQDLESEWFLRHDDRILTGKLQQIQEKLLSLWPMAADNNLLILMLVRVYRYAKEGSTEQEFLTKEINRLWKL